MANAVYIYQLGKINLDRRRHDWLKEEAARRGLSVSALIRDLIDKGMEK